MTILDENIETRHRRSIFVNFRHLEIDRELKHLPRACDERLVRSINNRALRRKPPGHAAPAEPCVVVEAHVVMLLTPRTGTGNHELLSSG